MAVKNNIITKRIIFIIISLIMIIVMLTSSTLAWFVFTRETGRVIYRSGEVNYIMYGKMIETVEDDIIIPGEELISSTIGIQSVSNIKTQLRLKISYQIEGGQISIFTASNNDPSSTTADLIGIIDPKFTYNEIDGYWYYIYSNGNTVIPETTDDPLLINIISSFKYNGNVYGTSAAQKKVAIHISFEAKQSDNVNWDDITWDTLTNIIIE